MKNTTIIVAVVVVLVVVLLFVFVGGRSNDTSTTSTPIVSSSTSVTPVASVRPPVVSPTKSAVPAADLNYNDAIKKYSSSRIQFGQYCNATPNRIVIKSGASVMLDNRSGDARTISLDTTSYNLAGYGFRIVTLTTTSASRTVVIDCGGAKNVGQIIIQK